MCPFATARPAEDVTDWIEAPLEYNSLPVAASSAYNCAWPLESAKITPLAPTTAAGAAMSRDVHTGTKAGRLAVPSNLRPRIQRVPPEFSHVARFEGSPFTAIWATTPR